MSTGEILKLFIAADAHYLAERSRSTACQHCAAERRTDDNYCRHCGARFVQAELETIASQCAQA